METEIKLALIDAVDLKRKSIKRAQNTATKPAFKELYEQELATLTKAENWINSQK